MNKAHTPAITETYPVLNVNSSQSNRHGLRDSQPRQSRGTIRGRSVGFHSQPEQGSDFDVGNSTRVAIPSRGAIRGRSEGFYSRPEQGSDFDVGTSTRVASSNRGANRGRSDGFSTFRGRNQRIETRTCFRSHVRGHIVANCTSNMGSLN